MGGDEQATFATLLRAFRGRAGLTQEELAERAGLSADAIGLLERGDRRQPQRYTVERLATALALADGERARFAAAAHAAVFHPSSQTVAALPTAARPFVRRAEGIGALLTLLMPPGAQNGSYNGIIGTLSGTAHMLGMSVSVERISVISTKWLRNPRESDRRAQASSRLGGSSTFSLMRICRVSWPRLGKCRINIMLPSHIGVAGRFGSARGGKWSGAGSARRWKSPYLMTECEERGCGRRARRS